MVDEDELKAKLAKVEMLHRRAGSPGERGAAGAARERLRGRLGGSDGIPKSEAELQFSLPGTWSAILRAVLEFNELASGWRNANGGRPTVDDHDRG